MQSRNNPTPCYGCSDRKTGCHGTCEKYIEYDKKNIQRRKDKADEAKGYKYPKRSY